jgi:hypothetical protein
VGDPLKGRGVKQEGGEGRCMRCGRHRYFNCRLYTKRVYMLRNNYYNSAIDEITCRSVNLKHADGLKASEEMLRKALFPKRNKATNELEELHERNLVICTFQELRVLSRSSN